MFDFSKLVGMTEKSAIAKIQKNNFKVRVRIRDDKKFMGTTDARPDRINLEVKNGKVVRAWLG